MNNIPARSLYSNSGKLLYQMDRWTDLERETKLMIPLQSLFLLSTSSTNTEHKAWLYFFPDQILKLLPSDCGLWFAVNFARERSIFSFFNGNV